MSEEYPISKILWANHDANQTHADKLNLHYQYH